MSKKLESQAQTIGDEAYDALIAACTPLRIDPVAGVDDTVPDIVHRVSDELHRRETTVGALSDAEGDLRTKCQAALQGHDAWEGTNCLVWVVSEFLDIPPPGLTLAAAQISLERVTKALPSMKQAVYDPRHHMSPFPDGKRWEPIFGSFYLYSINGIFNEAQLIDLRVRHLAKDKPDAKLPGKVVDLYHEHVSELKGTLDETTMSQFNFRMNVGREVCQVLHKARLIVSREKGFSKITFDAVESARSDFVQVLEKAEKSKKNSTLKKSRRHPDHSSAASLASLAHAPTARRLIGDGPLSYI
ncbi:uncharacterized protein JCM6883_001255 [Sporobolomyces salmoneus]|uniref:uncharacterized protein n=1 Tax=Sporobolomyces salmoneus TaxID=183962 RepID=UPI00317ADF63